MKYITFYFFALSKLKSPLDSLKGAHSTFSGKGRKISEHFSPQCDFGLPKPITRSKLGSITNGLGYCNVYLLDFMQH